MRLRSSLGLLAALCLAGLPAPAAAQEPAGTAADGTPLSAEEVERARNHFMAGTAYYQDSRWDNAAREFQEAYRITGHPDVLYNLGQAYDRMERRQEAIDAYRGYLEQAESAPDRDRVERRIRELQQLSMIDVTDHSATVPSADSADSRAGSGTTGPAPAEGNRFGILPWVSIGAGAAFAVGAAITGAMALGAYGNLEDACGPDRVCGPEHQDEIDSGGALVTWSTILTIGALLGVGVGVTLLVLGAADDEEPPAATVELTTGPAPAGMGARITF